jgi:hypothetical protein
MPKKTPADIVEDLHRIPANWQRVAASADPSSADLMRAADMLIVAMDLILWLNEPQTSRVREWLEPATSGAYERYDLHG